MRRYKKPIIWLLVVFVALVVIVFVAASVIVNRFKPDLENALTKNIGMETKIDGPIALKILPGISLVANNIKVISNETYFFRAKTIEISLDYLKLFSSEIHVNALHFNDPQVYIARDKDGVFNYQTAFAGMPGLNSDDNNYRLVLDELTINNGRIFYIDIEQGDSLVADGISLHSEEMNLPGTIDNIDPTAIEFSGFVEVNSFKLNMLQADSLHFQIDSRSGKLSIKPKDKSYFRGKSSGKAIVDLTQKPVFIHIQHEINGLDIGEFQIAAGAKELLFGSLNLNLDVTFQSFNWNQAFKTIKGEIKVEGENLLMQGIDLDKALAVYEATQEFDVSNLGALFVSGPYGAVFSKGMNYVAILTSDLGDATEINKFVSNWNLNKGIAKAQDVALSTNKYRLALNGNLDFTNNTYNNIVIAMINADGCAAISEEMNGSFIRPETQTLSSFIGLSGPAENFWMELAKPSRKTCEPFYKGSIEHPKVN